MVARDLDSLHQVIDTLSDDSLAKLKDYLDFLLYSEQRKVQQGSPWLREMVESFADVRDAVGASGMTEAEIDQMIADAVDEVRRERPD